MAETSADSERKISFAVCLNHISDCNMRCSGKCNLNNTKEKHQKYKKNVIFVISQSSKHPGCPYLIDKYGRPGHDCSCASTALRAMNATNTGEDQAHLIEDFSGAEFSHKNH